jgi:EpsI family protein
MVLFAVTFVCVRTATERRVAQSRQPNWSAVQYEFDGWSGTDGEFDPVYGTDPAQTSVLRVYRRQAAAPVIAYVGYYGDIAKILEVHTPERCYPGQGWRILSTGEFKAGVFRGRPIPAKGIVVEKGGSQRLVLWWYTAGSRPFETRIRYVYAMLAMSTLTGRTDGTLVRLEIPLNGDGEKAALQTIEQFQSHFLPQIDKALPQ